MDDPRIILEKAADNRIGCEVLPRSGGWGRGELLRVERGGVVILAPDLRLAGGEDVRVWFTLEGVPHTFEASVIRTGVPVPDRSQHGYLLGFLDGWTRGEAASAGQSPRPASPPVPSGTDVVILPPNGPGVSLVHGPGRLVDVSMDGLTFTLPSDYTLVFVVGGRVRFGFRVPGEEPHEISGRIHALVPAENHLLYTVQVEGVTDPELHRRLVAAVQRLVGAGETRA